MTNETLIKQMFEDLEQQHGRVFSSEEQRQHYLEGAHDGLQFVVDHLLPHITADHYEAVFDAWLTEAQTQIRMAPTIAGFDYAQGRIAALLACHDTLFAWAVRSRELS